MAHHLFLWHQSQFQKQDVCSCFFFGGGAVSLMQTVKLLRSKTKYLQLPGFSGVHQHALDWILHCIPYVYLPGYSRSTWRRKRFLSSLTWFFTYNLKKSSARQKLNREVKSKYLIFLIFSQKIVKQKTRWCTSASRDYAGKVSFNSDVWTKSYNRKHVQNFNRRFLKTRKVALRTWFSFSTLQILADFKNSFTVIISRKFAVQQSLTIPPHLKLVATLPCEMFMSEN